MSFVRFKILFASEVKRALNYFSTKFHEILTSDSVEISAFPLTGHAVTIFRLTAHALRLTGFSNFLDPFKQSQKGRVFSNSITFNTLKSERFSHIKNFLIVKTEKKNTYAILTEQNKIDVQEPCDTAAKWVRMLGFLAGFRSFSCFRLWSESYYNRESSSFV